MRSCTLALASCCLCGLAALASAGSCPPEEEKLWADRDCPRSQYKTQLELDECYMQIALDLGLEVLSKHPIEGPFGAVLVNQETNALLCMGCNRGDLNPMKHGETDLLENCTLLYPSPSGDNTRDPCIDYTKYTLYTTGEPCPLCATAIAYYKVGRVVTGTPEARLACIGLPAPRFNSSFINSQFQPAYPGASLTKGVLADKCDKAFADFWNYTLPEDWPASCPDWPDDYPRAEAMTPADAHMHGSTCSCGKSHAHSHKHSDEEHEHEHEHEHGHAHKHVLSDEQGNHLEGMVSLEESLSTHVA